MKLFSALVFGLILLALSQPIVAIDNQAQQAFNHGVCRINAREGVVIVLSRVALKPVCIASKGNSNKPGA
jgi:hypothetical protein